MIDIYCCAVQAVLLNNIRFRRMCVGVEHKSIGCTSRLRMLLISALLCCSTLEISPETGYNLLIKCMTQEPFPLSHTFSRVHVFSSSLLHIFTFLCKQFVNTLCYLKIKIIYMYVNQGLCTTTSGCAPLIHGIFEIKRAG